MTDDILDSRRDLVSRVAILELLVADLVDLLWHIEPQAMHAAAADAARDLESTGKRLSSASEHQRERLLAVLTERHRRLQHRRRGREPMVA
jgi:hypothetical protein